MDEIKPNQQEITKPWGKEILYAEIDSQGVGKILFIEAKKRLSLQYHDKKDETLCLFSGKAYLWIGEDKNSLQKIEMKPLHGYHVRPTIIHRIESVEDSVVLEVSNAEEGVTFRIEDDFKRPDETENIRSLPNRGWQAR